MTTTTDQPSGIRLRCVISTPEGSRAVSLMAPGELTLGRLAEHHPLVAAFEAGVWIAHHHFPPTTALADLPLYDGVEVHTVEPAVVRPAAEQLVGIAGIRSGSAVTPPPESARPPVAIVEFDDTVWMRSRTRSEAVSSTALAVHRPPRPIPVPPPAFPEPPAPEDDTPLGTPLRWTMIVGPILMGAVLVAMFRRWHFALFMLIGPFMAILNHLDAKVRRRSGRRSGGRRRAADLERFRDDVTGWYAWHHRFRTTAHPPVIECVWRARDTSDRLWERRPVHDDFLELLVGYGPADRPSVTGADAQAVVDEVAASRPAVPLTIRLVEGAIVGIVGARRAEVAQSWIAQLATHHGPADVSVACLTDDEDAWRWLEWLPHTDHLVTSDAGAILSRLRQGGRVVVFVDRRFSPELGVRVGELSAAEADVVVLADSTGQLPGTTSIVVTVTGAAVAVAEGGGGVLSVGTVVGMSGDVAESVARNLARLTDPEQREIGAGLPRSVRFVELVGELSPHAVQARWTNEFTAPVGMGNDGPVWIDIVADGPHGLLAGTTGSGKSEFLRTLVASLAVHNDPSHLNFVLIDYKGGSAFDVCAELPHVAGIVTDLDEHLAARAMTCLEAELVFREQHLRDSGVSDIADSDLPRLMIVIDEFAAMAADLPEFMAGLVDIAARGRSLGVHLLLATQRPAGIVKDSIRANTNLKISLRVQDPSDGRDVVDDAAPAHLPRTIPGRGYVRFGPAELIEFQSAYVSGSGAEAATVDIRCLGEVEASQVRPDGRARDLATIVAACRAAAAAGRHPRPRTPWPDPLPDSLALSAIETGSGIAYALADEPDLQRHTPFGWEPDRGHALFYGLPGSGAEVAVAAIVAALSSTEASATTEIFVLRHGTATIPDTPLVAQPVEADDAERRHRLIRRLGGLLDTRRAAPTAGNDRRTFLVVDDIADVLLGLEPYHLAAVRDAFVGVLTRGHAYGIHVVATARDVNAVRLRLAGSFTHRLAFGFADPTIWASLGVPPRSAPPDVVGRGIELAGLRIVQVATEWNVEVRDPAARRPTIPLLPATTAADGLTAGRTETGWWLPVGLDDDLEDAGLRVDEHDHVAVVGPARSGKSTALLTLARTLRSSDEHLTLVAVAPRRSPLITWDGFDHIVTDPEATADLARGLAAAEHPVVVVVDDAEMVDGFDDVIRSRRVPVTFLAGIRMEDAAGLYTHWTRRVLQSRLGVLLQPRDGAGDLLGVRLPKGAGHMPPGRGYLVQDGTARLIQAAQ